MTKNSIKNEKLSKKEIFEKVGLTDTQVSLFKYVSENPGFKVENVRNRINFNRLKNSLVSGKHIITEHTTDEEWNELVFGKKIK